MGRLLIVAAIAGSSLVSPAAAKPACNKAVGRASAGLPASVVLRTVCGSYAVQPDGAVSVSKPAPLRPPGVEVQKRRGHVVVVRDGRVIWRSQRVFRTRASPDGVVGERHVAFSFYNGRLWIAPLAGAERPVARHQDPLGWTRSEELLAVRWQRREQPLLYVHGSGPGSRVADGVRSLAWDQASATLLFVTREGMLVRTDGRVITPLRALPALGLPLGVQIEPLEEGLIGLPGRDRLVVLRGDGSMFASSLFPGVRRRAGWLAFDSWPAAGGGAVAFTIAEYDRSAVAHENVFVLHEGATDAARLLRTRVGYVGCAWYAGLAWHGRWLLYAAPAATQVVALDSGATDRRVDLSAFARTLPGVQVDRDGEGAGFVDASWVGGS
jgi:hypothetical protein